MGSTQTASFNRVKAHGTVARPRKKKKQQQNKEEETQKKSHASLICRSIVSSRIQYFASLSNQNGTGDRVCLLGPCACFERRQKKKKKEAQQHTNHADD